MDKAGNASENSASRRRERGIAAYAHQFSMPEAQVPAHLADLIGTVLAEEAFESAGGAAWHHPSLSPRDRPRLTPKGERARARIVGTAARLIYERGVAGTTLDDVKAAAEVSGSQMYHYFPDKGELVQAVIAYQADVVAGNQRQADLGSAEGLRAWRDMVIAQARGGEGKGGCPLGSLVGQLAETEPYTRALLADGIRPPDPGVPGAAGGPRGGNLQKLSGFARRCQTSAA